MLAGVVLVVLLLADAVYAGLRFRSEFQSAACDLKRAASGLEDLDADRADERLQSALASIDSARGYLGHPALEIAGVLPGISRDLDVLDSLTDVAERAARSGRVGAKVVHDLGMSEGASFDEVYSDGKVNLDALVEARSSVEEAREHLLAARDSLRAAPRATFGKIRSSRSTAGSLVAEALRSLDDTSVVLEDLPGVLGGEGQRTYLLAFQAPSEARGGGGLIGVYGLLRAEDGALDMIEVAPIRDLVPHLTGKVKGPAWFESLYGGLDGLGGWREANSSPTFPVTSRILLKMYERSTGDRLDGVMAMDPVVVAEMLEGIGPIRTSGYAEPVHSGNAGRVLMRDIYLRFAGREDDQNRFLRDLVDEIWARLGDGDVDAKKLMEALARSISSGRLKFYSSERTERDALSVAGIDGDPRSHGPNTQMIFHNNFAANKIDWYLSRAQSTTVSIDEEGTGHFVTRIQLANNAPRGQRSLLKKSDVNELPSGMNLMSLHFMLPEGAEVGEMYSGSTPIEHFEGSEAGTYPVVWSPLQLAVGARSQVSVTYEVPDLVRFHNGRARFEMNFLPQGVVRADDFALKVTVPEGYRIGSAGSEPDSTLLRSGTLDQNRSVRAQIVVPGGDPPDRTRSFCSRFTTS